jgi:DNA-binding HxlR family transcriptional regulator
MIAPRSQTESQPFVVTLASIGRHLATAILQTLSDGPRNFNEILGALADVDDGHLGAGLRELDAGGLVVRRVEPGPPLRVLYELTPAGLELAPTLRIVADWAQRTGL